MKTLICSLENNIAPLRKYEGPVNCVLHTEDVEQYRKKADEINERNDIGMVQQEFGLFSGISDDVPLSFMLALNKPIVTVFHTVLPNEDNSINKNTYIMKQKFKINGISCGSCKQTVEKALKGVNGVTSAQVNLKSTRSND